MAWKIMAAEVGAAVVTAEAAAVMIYAARIGLVAASWAKAAVLPLWTASTTSCFRSSDKGSSCA